MTAVILAAGYATRLYPLTENFPKPLLEVGGKSITDRLIEDLEGIAGRFVVISNHKYFPIFKAWAEGRESITVLDDGTVSNETRLGAVKDIRFAIEKLELKDDLFVMAGDNVLDFTLKDFAEYAINAGTSAVMCHEENRPEALRKTAVITVNDEGLITSYEEKPQEPKGNLAVPPFYYYRAEDAALIPEALESGCGYDAPGSFAAWLSSRVPMHAWKMTGKRYDIGDIRSYEDVKRRFEG
ncbi:MAG: nucleotidyltransferase family protein [Oscillospiraceae bacterium]|nr:nucleotidyltransferase family protein [Oscillospiraceae bacterium]